MEDSSESGISEEYLIDTFCKEATKMSDGDKVKVHCVLQVNQKN